MCWSPERFFLWNCVWFGEAQKYFFNGFYLVWRSSQKNLWILPGVVEPKSIFLGILPAVMKPRNFSMDFTWSGGAQINFFTDFSQYEEAPKPLFMDFIWNGEAQTRFFMDLTSFSSWKIRNSGNCEWSLQVLVGILRSELLPWLSKGKCLGTKDAVMGMQESGIRWSECLGGKILPENYSSTNFSARNSSWNEYFGIFQVLEASLDPPWRRGGKGGS